MWKPLFTVFRKETLLDEAFEDAYKMYAMVEKMFLEARKCFRNQKINKDSMGIYKSDRKVNKLERKVRKKVVNHLSSKGSDEIYSGLLLVSVIIDMERIGDYTKNVLELAINHTKKLKCTSYEKDLSRIESAVEDTFARVGKLFKNIDMEDGKQLLKEYRWINKTCDQRTKDLLNEQDKSIPICSATALALYFRYLKRINSHLRNIVTSVVNPFDQIGFTHKLKLKSKSEVT